MERYAAGTRCRHRALVEYFGEPYDARRLRRVRLVPEGARSRSPIRRPWRRRSCRASRASSRPGASAHVTDVLIGKRDREGRRRAATHELSTFGLLKEESAAAVRGYIEQLVGDGLLARDGDPYPVLRLTTAGAALLRGEGDCVAVSRSASRRRQKRSRAARARQRHGHGVDPDLFDVLREVRLRLARERGVPPYVIFHDTTLRDMVRAAAEDARRSARGLRRRREEGGRLRRRVPRRDPNVSAP